MSRSRARRQSRRPASDDWSSEDIRRVGFVTAIGLSAFLLFTLELRAGRQVLPVFGGAPAVWTTSLCFFTAVLFVGYVYAHFAATRIPFRIAGIIQIALAVTALVIVVVAPTNLAGLRVSGLSDSLNVLLVLGVIAGGPAFLLATTTPLLSAWYADQEENPWWLFAVSNGASFVGLLAYPLLIGPNIGLSDQRILFIVGLALFAASLTTVVVSVRRATLLVPPAPPEPSPPLTARRQLIWLFAALVPAGLLSATTNFLQTDLISAPLIWIGPLAVYLASFVVAFAGRARPVVTACNWLVPAATTLLWIPFIKPSDWPPVPLFILELGALFILAVAIHGRLALDRPPERQLTRFYLILTAGGALGTAFVSLLAPQIFNDIYEYPLLIVAGLIALAILPGEEKAPVVPAKRAPKPGAAPAHASLLDRLRDPDFGRDARIAVTTSVLRVAVYGAVAGVIYLLIDAKQSAGVELASDVGLLLLAGALVVFLAYNSRTLVVVAPIALVVLVALNWRSPLLRERTFFGVIEVRQEAGFKLEYSGTTLHGLQFDDDRGKEPSTYYSRVGPLGDVFTDLRNHAPSANIGVVGLGIGTTAAYAQQGDTLTFFEIDSAVVDIAQNPKYFRYMTDAAVRPNVVLGDARLTLENQPDAQFDLLILDAFSSDAVPAHLLTKEAMQTYVRVLKPNGVLAFHLSNRYYNLVDPVSGTAKSLGMSAYWANSSVGTEALQKYGATEATWLVATKGGNLGAFPGLGWRPTPPGYILTDDFSDLTRSLNGFF